jgi:hypothetical protein
VPPCQSSDLVHAESNVADGGCERAMGKHAPARAKCNPAQPARDTRLEAIPKTAGGRRSRHGRFSRSAGIPEPFCSSRPVIVSAPAPPSPPATFSRLHRLCQPQRPRTLNRGASLESLEQCSPWNFVPIPASCANSAQPAWPYLWKINFPVIRAVRIAPPRQLRVFVPLPPRFSPACTHARACNLCQFCPDFGP